MALTTTAWNACDAVVQLDNSSGNLIDISGSSNSVEIDFKNDIGDYKVFGTKWKGRLACGKDATIKIKIVASKSAAEAMKASLDWFFNTSNSRSIRIQAPDATSGSDQYDAEVVLESFSIPMPADNASPVMCELNLLPNGAVNYTSL